MKRILSLILSLILCFGFIVSCEKEEEQSSVPTSTPTSEAPSSSEPTQETPSSSEPTQETPSSSEPPVSEEPSADGGNIIYDEGEALVFEKPENAYAQYKVLAKNYYSLYQNWIFNDYASYSEFVSQNMNSNNYISEGVFVDNFIVVIYRNDDPRRTENYSYSNLKKFDGNYFLIFEYTKVPSRAYTDNEQPDSFDIIVIPRNECEDNPAEIKLYLTTLVHTFIGKEHK